MSGHVVIAVDGPAASGKGTLARRLAAELGYAYLDTGLLYRAVGLILIRQGLDPADENAAIEAATVFDAAMADLKDPALRDEETGKAAGIVAAFPAVRAALVDVQRQFAANPPGGAEGGARGDARGAVLDGRDIGTVICPDADCKFFIEADIEERARRRVKELQDRGDTVILARVLQEMKERDERDRTRAVAPLAPAADASVVNTTNLNADAAFALAMSFIR
jgi:cytidylate kinase